MRNLKKKIPLLILKTLEKWLAKENERIQLIEPDNFLLKFIDTDEDSDFYFNIESYKVEANNYQLLLDYKPQSEQSVANQRKWTNHKSLDNLFNNWVMVLEQYDNVKTIFDDSIEKKYQEEFFTEFEIIDEDADTVSFNIEQQLFLNKYLGNVNLAIDRYNPDGEIKELNELKEIVIELDENLTVLTKHKIIKKLSIIWAKARKFGLPLLKEILMQAKGEIISQLIKAAIG